MGNKYQYLDLEIIFTNKNGVLHNIAKIEIALNNYFTKRKEKGSGIFKSILKSKKKKVTA
jgi:hypothetical protein